MAGAVALQSRFPEIIASLPKRGKLAELELAEGIASRAADSAPVNTGKLRDSIEGREHPSGTGAGVWAVWYWFLVEFGTTQNPPHAFMLPAFHEALAATPTAVR